MIPFLNERILLQKPDTCPDDVFDLMSACWRKEPQQRHSFQRLYDLLVDIKDNCATVQSQEDMTEGDKTDIVA